MFGYDTGVISGALLFIGKDFPGLTSFDKELLTSILLIGALIGALVAGRIADRVGRRLTGVGTAALFVAGVLLAAVSPSYDVLVAARVVIGLAVGFTCGRPALHRRDRPRGSAVPLSASISALTSGILALYLVDYGLASSQNWRLTISLTVFPAVSISRSSAAGNRSAKVIANALSAGFHRMVHRARPVPVGSSDRVTR